jgi:hypothetical protein
LETQPGVREWLRGARETIATAFAEFLTLPSAIIAAFIFLAAASYHLDLRRPATLEPLRALLAPYFFPDAAATAALVAGIAAAIISVTSITVTLLLLVVQQSASAMTAQVFDQFLRRRSNQFFFGFFVGLALFSLITQATVHEGFIPVFGASLVILLTAVALYMLVVLLYMIINQTRPTEITAAIHDHILKARLRELAVIRKTRAPMDAPAGTVEPVRADRHGFVVRIDVERLCNAVGQSEGSWITLCVSIGSYVSFGDTLANVGGKEHAARDALAKAVASALVIQGKRDVAWDAIYGVEALQTIGWTAISSAKSNPATGLTAVRASRDLLARWASDGPVERESDAPPVVYADTTIDRLFDAFETFAVASCESRQHQAYAEVLETFATLLPRLPASWLPRVERTIERILAGAKDHIPTQQIEDSLASLGEALDARSCMQAAEKVGRAQRDYAARLARGNP